MRRYMSKYAGLPSLPQHAYTRACTGAVRCPSLRWFSRALYAGYHFLISLLIAHAALPSPRLLPACPLLSSPAPCLPSPPRPWPSMAEDVQAAHTALHLQRLENTLRRQALKAAAAAAMAAAEAAAGSTPDASKADAPGSTKPVLPASAATRAASAATGMAGTALPVASTSAGKVSTSLHPSGRVSGHQPASSSVRLGGMASPFTVPTALWPIRTAPSPAPSGTGTDADTMMEAAKDISSSAVQPTSPHGYRASSRDQYLTQQQQQQQQQEHDAVHVHGAGHGSLQLHLPLPRAPSSGGIGGGGGSGRTGPQRPPGAAKQPATMSTVGASVHGTSLGRGGSGVLSVGGGGSGSMGRSEAASLCTAKREDFKIAYMAFCRGGLGAFYA